MNRAIPVLCVLALGGLVAAVALRDSGAPVAVTVAALPAGASSTGFSTRAAAGNPVAANFVTGLEALPASLAGSEVNGALPVDAAGHLVVDVAVRDLFDYFLAAVGEESLDTVAARLRAFITHRLQAPVRAEALALLDSYLAFWQEAGALSRAAQAAPGRDTPAAMAAYLAQMRALRSRHFDRTVDAAFFAAQDAYHDYTLARVRVTQDASLDEVARARQLGSLLAQLPPSLQESLRTATVIQTLDDMTGRCRQSGCTPQQLQQVREELVGAAAAQRLGELDREEAALQARLAAYVLQRDRIASNPAYDEADRAAQVAALQQEMFSAEEQLRLVALERIHDRGQAAN